MGSYIDRQKLEAHFDPCISGKTAYTADEVLYTIQVFPAADVVSKDVYDQIKWERDIAIETLREHGLELGERADVQSVVHAHWRRLSDTWCKCSHCGHEMLRSEPRVYCPVCGAKMDGVTE